MEFFDVPGEYLNAYMPEDKFVLLKIEGGFVDILCEVNPKHKKFIHVGNVVKLLYLCLLKSLDGRMESALLWYDLYSKTLKSQGFLIHILATSQYQQVRNTSSWEWT